MPPVDACVAALAAIAECDAPLQLQVEALSVVRRNTELRAAPQRKCTRQQKTTCHQPHRHRKTEQPIQGLRRLMTFIKVSLLGFLSPVSLSTRSASPWSP